MGGVDQVNQLWAAFTTHFCRNLKEFISGIFWCLNLAVTNSYKLNLAINGIKKTKNDKWDTSQHQEYIEDLVNLLFCVNSEEFAQKII